MAEPLRQLRRAVGQRGPLLVAILLTAIYIALMGTLSVRRHQNLGTNALDLGYTDQAVWNTLHGRPFRFSAFVDAEFRLDIPVQEVRQPDMLLAYHVEPILAAIAPVYLLHDGPETLLWLQTISIGLGAVVVYLVAQQRMAPRIVPAGQSLDEQAPRLYAWTQRWLPIAFVLLYLLSPPLQAANLSDFHAVALSPVLLLAAFYFLETDRPWGFLLSSLLAALCREEIGLLVALLGLWAALRWRHWRLGLAVALAGAGWSVLCFTVIMPHFSGLGSSAFLVRYGQFGDSLSAILGNLVRRPGLFLDWLRRPDVLRYLRDLWLSSGGLAVLYPPGIAISLPSLAINTFSSSAWMHSGGAHYSAPIVPFLLISAIYGTTWAARAADRSVRRRIDSRARSACVASESNRTSDWHVYELVGLLLAGLGLAVALANQYQRGVLPLSRRFMLGPVDEHARRAQLVVERVNSLPPDVPISVGSNLYPHVAHRQHVYLFPTVSDAQFVLLDVTGQPFPTGWGDQVQIVQQLLDYDSFGVAAADHGVLLLERDLDSYWWSPQFYDAFLAGDSVPRIQVGARFGSLMELTGFDWVILPVVTSKPLVQIATYWRVLAPPSEGCRLAFYYLDNDGKVVGIRPEELAANWYPLWMWEPGQVVKITLPPSPLDEVPHVGVALLRPRAELSDPAGRVTPISPTSNRGLTLWKAGTILELARP
jgi:uncharacterized membrane protein